MFWLRVGNRINLIYTFFEDIVYDAMWDKKDGPKNPMTFSLGRTSFIIWFFFTIKLVVLGASLTYLWYLLGLSLLSYVVGKQYIITSLGGVTLHQSQDLDETSDHS
jgi:hypothetical protein